MWRINLCLIIALSGGPSVAAEAARGMGLNTYIRLQQSMTEGELLSRAGAPDHVAVEGVSPHVTKSFYYYPTTSDPFITVVTVRGGRISNLERTKKF